MKISKINTMCSFGKTPLMTCSIKQKSDNQRVQATLYKIDSTQATDIDDVRYSKLARCMYSDLLNAFKKCRSDKDFLLLQNDKTKEVISCAQTSHRYRPFGDKPERYTLVETLNGNDKYINGIEPLMAYIASAADSRFDDSVRTAFHSDDISVNMQRIKFSQEKNGEWVLPKKRYYTLIDKAQEHSQLQLLC